MKEYLIIYHSYFVDHKDWDKEIVKADTYDDVYARACVGIDQRKSSHTTVNFIIINLTDLSEDLEGDIDTKSIESEIEEKEEDKNTVSFSIGWGFFWFIVALILLFKVI